MSPEGRKNVVDLFAGAFQKTTADFIQLFMLLWFVLKMVWIILYHAVSFCTTEEGIKESWPPTVPWYNFKVIHQKFRTTPSLPTWGYVVSSLLIPTINTKAKRRRVSSSLASSGSNLKREGLHTHTDSKDSLHHIFLSSQQNVGFSKTFSQPTFHNQI